MPIIDSRHALDMLAERDIERDRVERTVAAPELIEPDLTHDDRTRAFRALPERGWRVVRVEYAEADRDVRIITLRSYRVCC